MTASRILVFAPHAFIEPHASLEKLIAQFMVPRAANVALIRCNGLFSGGCAIHLNGDPSNLARLCDSCIWNNKKLDFGMRYQVLNAESMLSQEDRLWVDREMQMVRRVQIGEYRIGNSELGRAWMFDIILRFKEYNPDSPQFRQLYWAAARSGLLAYRLGVKANQLFEPTSVIVYSFEYSINRSFVAAFEHSAAMLYDARQSGPLDNRFSKMLVRRVLKNPTHLPHPTLNPWLGSPLTPPEAKLLLGHARFQIFAKSVFTYSAARGGMTSGEVRRALGIPRDSKVASFLLSSPDEPLARKLAGLGPDWDPVDRDFHHISRVLEVATKLPHVTFVFRLHPRLAPNRRDSVTSPYLVAIMSQIQEASESLSNLVIDAPDNSIGIYDLALVTNVVLSYRSSAAVEMGLLGIPVLQVERSSDPFLAEESSLRTSYTRDDLSAAISSALERGFDYQGVVKYARLQATQISRVNIDLQMSQIPWLAKVLWFISGRMGRRILRFLPKSVYRYSFVDALGGLALEPRHASIDVADSLLASWAESAVPVAQNQSDESKSLLWLHGRLFRLLRPFDGLEGAVRDRVLELGLLSPSKMLTRDHDE